MSSIYPYTLSTDFSNGVNSAKLYEEIIAVITSPVLEYINVNTSGDLVEIVFAASLSGPQEITLDGLVAAHDGSPTIVLKSRTIAINTETKLEYYHKINTFFFSGSLKEDIRSISVIANIKNDTNSYDVRIYDKTNKQVIASANFTNVESELNDLGTLSNIPTGESIFELQVKSNKKNQIIVVSELVIYYKADH